MSSRSSIFLLKSLKPFTKSINFYELNNVWEFIKVKKCTFYWLIRNFLSSRENFEKESTRTMNIHISSFLTYSLTPIEPFFVSLSISRLAAVCSPLSFDQTFNRIRLRNVLIVDWGNKSTFFLKQKIVFHFIGKKN